MRLLWTSDRGVRVALVSDWYLPRLGGLELHLRDLAEELAGRGHDVHLVTTTPTDDVRQGDLQTADLPDPEGVNLRRLEVPLLPGAGLAWPSVAAAAVGDALDAIGPDVVHAHAGLVPPLALSAACEARRRGMPVVLTFHSVFRGYQTAWRLGRRVLGWDRWADVLSAVGPGIAGEVAEMVPGREVDVLPNGIDPEAWLLESGEREPRAPDHLRLVTVARLQRRKRTGVLLRAVAAARERLNGEAELTLSVVGDGPLRPALERKARRLGLGDGIRFEGSLERRAIRDVFARSDVFVLASVRESFGLSALEARCAGLPVVARGDSGVAAHVEHRRHGLLAPDDGTLASHLVLLARDPALLERLGAHNRATRTRFAWPGVVARHLEAYADAAVSRARATPAKPTTSQPVPASGSR